MTAHDRQSARVSDTTLHATVPFSRTPPGADDGTFSRQVNGRRQRRQLAHRPSPNHSRLQPDRRKDEGSLLEPSGVPTFRRAQLPKRCMRAQGSISDGAWKKLMLWPLV